VINNNNKTAKGKKCSDSKLYDEEGLARRRECVSMRKRYGFLVLVLMALVTILFFRDLVLMEDAFSREPRKEGRRHWEEEKGIGKRRVTEARKGRVSIQI